MTDEETLSFLVHLKTATRARLYFAAAMRSQWWGSTRDLTTLAHVPHRRGEIELAELVDDEWLKRDEKGAKNQDRLVHFEPGPAAINLIAALRSKRSHRRDQNDRSGTIEVIAPPRSERSQHSTGTHARAPAPPDLDPSQDCRPPSVREGYGEGHARTGDAFTGSDVRGSDVQWVMAQWSVSGAVAHQCWTRLLGFGTSRREGREYLEAARRGTHAAFRGLERADRPLGAACTLERFEPWRASRARAMSTPAPAPTDVRDTRPSREDLDETIKRAENAQRVMRGEVLTEAEAIGELALREAARGRGGRT